MAEIQWKIKPLPDQATVSQLVAQLGIKKDMATLLAQRGISDFEEARRFFRPSLDLLHDPFLMKDMRKAVDRLQSAFDLGEKILVYGDYDVDGTTAVSLMYSFLKNLGKVDFYIPDRYEEGYGLSDKGIDHAAEHQFKLIITLDCGIKAVDKVERAKKLGIDVIICDHHLPGTLPDAAAILDPKQPGCTYPFKELSGCGVGFKFMQGLCKQSGMSTDALFEKLQLVAISIASDIVPIVGENRILAAFGLDQLNKTPSIGIKALLGEAKVNGPLTIGNVVFMIGPRINAAGRIASGRKAVELLISDNMKEAGQFSSEINSFNTERKDLDRQVTREALEIIGSDPFYRTSVSTVVFGKDWHKGVVGIVASRIIESYYKPTIVLTESNGMATGSARSVSGFDIHEALTACKDLLERFGGHRYAAGMSLRPENVTTFRKRFNEAVSERITEDMLIRKLNIDLDLGLDRISESFMALLKQFGPFGPGNMSPVFRTCGLVADDVRKMGADGAHLSFLPVQQGKAHQKLKAVAFNMGELTDVLRAGKQQFDMAYTIEENHWKNRIYLQLMVKGIRFSEPLPENN